MKESYYNLFVPIQDKVVCFNTLNNMFTTITKGDYKVLKSDMRQLRENLKKRLKENKFLIDDNIDEFKQIEKRYHEKTQNSTTYELVLLPTLDCNLRCWYCFEKHIKGSRLSSRVQENIFKHVQNVLELKNISDLYVTLFGGEPLMYFKEELYPLLKKIQEYTIGIGKTVRFSFITNGTFIDENSIPLFKELNAGFQISIDGYREKHNAVKKAPGLDQPYDVVMRAIHMLCKSYNPHITLRINYDNQTLLYIEEVIKDIIDIDRSKIRIHLERVWQTVQIRSHENLLKKAITLFLINGFRVSYLNLMRDGDSCKASEKHHAEIAYDGIVYKCTGRDFTKEQQEGILTDTGHIQWNQEKIDKRLSLKTYDNEQCRACKLLPLCWGPCCQKQLEGKTSREVCQLNTMEMPLSEYILFLFNNCIIENRLREKS